MRSPATARSRPGPRNLELNDAANLLGETLKEEIETDELGTRIATSSVNMKAA